MREKIQVASSILCSGGLYWSRRDCRQLRQARVLAATKPYRDDRQDHQQCKWFQSSFIAWILAGRMVIMLAVLVNMRLQGLITPTCTSIGIQ